jgi:molybdenum cofactor cytidylyltransferase
VWSLVPAASVPRSLTLMMQPRGVALVILAAGGPQRVGQPKQSFWFRKRSLLRHVETGVASMCRPIVVAIGAYAEVVGPELRSLPVTIAYNQQGSSGTGSSLRVAMEALAAFDDIEGTVITLSDQPLVTADALNQIVEAHYMTGQDIVASEYEGARPDDSQGWSPHVHRRPR